MKHIAHLKDNIEKLKILIEKSSNEKERTCSLRLLASLEKTLKIAEG